MFQTESFFKFKEKEKVNIKESRVVYKLKKRIIYNLNKYNQQKKDLLILCIGSDRATGDALGPLIGTELNKFKFPSTKILGSLRDPVHAKNLKKIYATINRDFSNHFIIAIDASLGKKESIGNISIKPGPLKPGAGVNKDLPAIGNLQITGLVNTGGYMEYLVLQSTRLNLVYQMAQKITKSLLFSIRKFDSNK